MLALVLVLLLGCGSNLTDDNYDFRGARTGLFESLFKRTPVVCVIELGGLMVRFNIDDDEHPETGNVILRVPALPPSEGERVRVGGPIMTHSSAAPGADIESILAGIQRTFDGATSYSIGRQPTGNVSEIIENRVVFLHGLHFEAAEIPTVDGSIAVPESRVEDVVLFCPDQRESL